MIVPEIAQSSPLSRDQLMTDQNNDPELCKLADKAFSSEEASDVGICYYDNEKVVNCYSTRQ